MAFDRPFFYIFDADNVNNGGSMLTNGMDYNNLGIETLPDSDFYLRRIAGRATVADKMQWYDASRRQKFSASSAIPNDFLIVPEEVYPGGTLIGFDLVNVSKSGVAYVAGGSVPNYYSQIAFQGVRRYPGTYNGVQTQYTYHERIAQLSTSVTIDWTGRYASAYTQLQPPRQFTYEVLNYDFELFQIGLTIEKNGADPIPAYHAVKVLPYGVNNYQMATAPVVDFYLSCIMKDYNSSWPCPPLLYPAGSQIQFDVESLLIEAEVPATLTITFFGVQRIPC